MFVLSASILHTCHTTERSITYQPLCYSVIVFKILNKSWMITIALTLLELFGHHTFDKEKAIIS